MQCRLEVIWNQIKVEMKSELVADSGLFVKIKGEEIYVSKEVKTKEKVLKITPQLVVLKVCKSCLRGEQALSVVVKHASKQSLNVSTESAILQQ